MVTFAVIGCGFLGIKIAGELLIKGASVRMYDKELRMRDEALNSIAKDRRLLVDDGVISDDHVMGKLLILNRLEDVLKGCDIVIEAIVENYIIKKQLFHEIDNLVSASTILTSNTLEIDFSKVVEDLRNKERTVALRFLYPVYGINDVEITPTMFTSNDTVKKVQDLMHCVDKTLFLRNGEEALILNEEDASNRILSYKEREKLRKVELGCAGHMSSISKQDTPPMSQRCVICLTGERNTLLTPCNHVALCMSCADSVMSRQEGCPVCRGRIADVVRVYHS